MAEHRAPGNALVSVILPVHNGAPFLREAIESVLRQAYRPIEIVVVDDGSTDETASIVRGFGQAVRYIHQENAGPAAARNRGIRSALGSLIAFIDADDVWPDEKLTLQMRCFEAWPGIDVVQGLIRRIQHPEPLGQRRAPIETDVTFIHTNLGSMLMRRSVFDAVGWFDETLRFHEDTDFWLRLLEAGLNLVVQRRVGLIYRIHDRSTTAGRTPQSMGVANIIRRSMLRRTDNFGHIRLLRKLRYVHDLKARSHALPTAPENALEGSPLVSIIAYGADAASAARTVPSILAQGYQPAELLVVATEAAGHLGATDDQSVRIVQVEQNGDLAAGLNAAIEAAQGEMVAFLDLSGRWTPGKLAAQVARLQASRGDAYVAGRTRHVLDPLAVYPSGMIESLDIKTGPGELLPTLMARRWAFAEVGGFAGGLDGMEATDWVLRAHDRGFANNILPQALFLRYFDGSTDLPRSPRSTMALLESVRASVNRKRAARIPGVQVAPK